MQPAALLEAAAEARAHQAEFVAQDIQQRRRFVIKRNADGLAVDGKGVGLRHSRLTSERLIPELLAQDPFVEIVTRVEQHVERDAVVHADVDAAYRTHFIVVGDRGDCRLSASWTSMVTLALLGSNAPRQPGAEWADGVSAAAAR